MPVAGAAQEPSVPVVQQEDVPNMDEILNRMRDHDEWQAQFLVEYRAQRKFHAENLRFKEDATLEVMTTFRCGYILQFRNSDPVRSCLHSDRTPSVGYCPNSKVRLSRNRPFHLWSETNGYRYWICGLCR